MKTALSKSYPGTELIVLSRTQHSMSEFMTFSSVCDTDQQESFVLFCSQLVKD